MEMTNILTKLTVKEMKIDGAAIIANMAVGQTVVVARIYGEATKYKTSPSKFTTTDLPREDHQFVGNFEGVNLITGEVFNAPKCFLPGAAPDAVANALDNAEGGSIEFGVEIAIQKVIKKDGTEGYKFGVAVPKQPSATDPLAAMREKMASLPGAVTQAMLAAPKAEEAPKPAPKAAKAKA